MKNSIVASLVFCYQGKTYTPKACIDLDNVMETTGMLPDLYEYLAIENEIGIYSYMYEIMEGNPIVF
ncbi:MAG: hypothetical protein R3240_08365 [Gammaproteobacteria bacterium]|nr:hypothetical protein [Gammaproteobacteria bacterium]